MIGVVAALLGRLPLGLATRLAQLVAVVWWWLLPVRRGVARENLRLALPELPAGATLRTLVADLALSYVELAHLAAGREDTRVEFEHTAGLRDSLPEGGAVLVATHTAGWDLVVVAAGLQGWPMTVAVRPPTWPPLARWIDRVRRSAGIELVPPLGSWRSLREALGRGRVVVLLLDQRDPAGLPVPFFGRPAWTTRAPALLSSRSGRPVFFAEQRRLGPGHHQVRVRGPLPLTGDVLEDTVRLAALCEEAVRSAPQRWLWLHRRWKTP